MQLPNTEFYEHDGKEFQIIATASGSRFMVVVTLDNAQVSPNYSVEITVHQDYFMDHHESLVEHLVEIAKSDLERGVYYRS